MSDNLVGGFSVRAAVWRRRWLALGVFAGVLLAVAGWLAFAERSYTASATVTAAPSSALLQSTGNFEDLQATLAQIANSQSVLDAVTGRLSEERTVDQLRDEVHGTHVSGTVLIRITVTDTQPRAAADIANAVATELPLHDPSAGMFSFTQTDPARVPSTYSSPNTKIVVLAGAALAILLAVGAALLYDSVAGTVDTPDQLGAIAGIGVLATVPRCDLSQVSVANGDRGVAAAFRSLRAAVESASRDKPIDAIVVATLARDRRLGGWLACNLAAAFAQMHQSVLLVDGAPGASAAHPALNDHGSTGLCAVLREEASLEEAVRAGPVEGLTILPAGHAAPDSAVDLVERRLHKVLADVDGRFDIVVVLAPSPATFDTIRSMVNGGSLLLAVPARRVRVATLRRLADEFRSNRIPVLGAVLIGRRRPTLSRTFAR